MAGRQADRSQVSLASTRIFTRRTSYSCYICYLLFREQAFNDIFGRPTGATRPSYNHHQGVRPSPSMRLQTGSPYISMQQQQGLAMAPQQRPQSTYGGAPLAGGNIGLPYPPNSAGQYQQQQQPPPPHGQQHYQQQRYQQHQHLPYDQTQNYSDGVPGPSSSSQYHGLGNEQHVLPLPPAPPQGPAFRSLDAGGGRESGGGRRAGPSASHPAASGDGAHSSSAAQYALPPSIDLYDENGPGGSAPPRLPSFEAADDFNWFDGAVGSNDDTVKQQQRHSRQQQRTSQPFMEGNSGTSSNSHRRSGSANVTSSTVRADGLGPNMAFGVTDGSSTASSSRSNSNSVVPSIQAPSRSSSQLALGINPSASSSAQQHPQFQHLRGDNTPGPYTSNSQNSSRRSFTASSTVSSNTADYYSDNNYNSYAPAKDSPVSGISGGSSAVLAPGQQADGQYACKLYSCSQDVIHAFLSRRITRLSSF